MKNWDLIAEELQTGRTAFQCFSHYQRHLNEHLWKWGHFTPEESRKVLRVVEEIRIGNYIPWFKAELYIEGRTDDQIRKHYYLAAKEDLNRSPWTKEEDAMVLACTKRFGTHYWHKTQKYLPDRTAINIKQRYEWFLNPVMKNEPFTDEENIKLIRLLKTYGFGNWRDVSKQMPGRPKAILKTQSRKLLIRDKNTNKVRFKFPEEVKELSKTVGANQVICMQRRKDIIDSAYETLKSALTKIHYHIRTPLTLENLSSISVPALRMLHKELMKHKKRSIRWNINMNWKTQFPDRRPEVHDSVSDSDSEDETEVNVEKPKKDIESNWMNPKVIPPRSRTDLKDKECKDDEKAFLEKVFHSQLEAEADRKPSPYNTRKMIANFDLCSTLEYSLYEEYLEKIMTCSETTNKEEDGIMNFINGRNYKISLPAVIHHFISPSVSENRPLVLPPSCTTLDAMDKMVASDSKLHKTGDLVDHSALYLRYLLNLTEEKPKCVHCSQAGNSESSSENYKAAIDHMKSHLVLPTKEMKKSAMVETIFPAIQLKECSCAELHQSKATVDVLTRRFIALFMWPYLLHTIEPTNEQTELLFREGCYRAKQRKPYLRRLKRKCENDEEEDYPKRQRRKESEDTETEEEDYDSDILCLPSTNVRSQSLAEETVQKNPEVVCLSDSYEDFPFAESME